MTDQDTFKLKSLKITLFCSSAPSHPPEGVRASLIEDGTALVSWREPEENNLAVTHYTILYASQRAWLAGHWQTLQREGEYGH